MSTHPIQRLGCVACKHNTRPHKDKTIHDLVLSRIHAFDAKHTLHLIRHTPTPAPCVSPSVCRGRPHLICMPPLAVGSTNRRPATRFLCRLAEEGSCARTAINTTATRETPHPDAKPHATAKTTKIIEVSNPARTAACILACGC